MESILISALMKFSFLWQLWWKNRQHVPSLHLGWHSAKFGKWDFTTSTDSVMVINYMILCKQLFCASIICKGSKVFLPWIVLYITPWWGNSSCNGNSAISHLAPFWYAISFPCIFSNDSNRQARLLFDQ